MTTGAHRAGYTGRLTVAPERVAEGRTRWLQVVPGGCGPCRVAEGRTRAVKGRTGWLWAGPAADRGAPGG